MSTLLEDQIYASAFVEVTLRLTLDAGRNVDSLTVAKRAAQGAEAVLATFRIAQVNGFTVRR